MLSAFKAVKAEAFIYTELTRLDFALDSKSFSDRIFSVLTHTRKIECKAFPEFLSWTEGHPFVTDLPTREIHLENSFIITVTEILFKSCVQI